VFALQGARDVVEILRRPRLSAPPDPATIVE